MAPPFSSRTLKPLSSGGLWLAVTLTAPTAPRLGTLKLITGVGVALSVRSTRKPLPASTSATAAAKCSPEKRLSWPTITLLPARPLAVK